MQRQKYISLGQAIENWVSQHSSNRKKIDEASVINNWKDFVGIYIAQHTQDVQIRNGILNIKVQSGVVRQELLILRAPLKEKINQKYGYELLHDIRLDLNF